MFVWFSRAVERLDAARAQKEIPESTRTVKQQELHKTLRVCQESRKRHRLMMLSFSFTFNDVIYVLFRMWITSAAKLVMTVQYLTASLAPTLSCLWLHHGMFYFIFNYVLFIHIYTSFTKTFVLRRLSCIVLTAVFLFA